MSPEQTPRHTDITRCIGEITVSFMIAPQEYIIIGMLKGYINQCKCPKHHCRQEINFGAITDNFPPMHLRIRLAYMFR